MNILDRYWADLISLAIILVFFNGAITGNFYTHGRGGGRKLIAATKSLWARSIFLIFAIALTAWLIKDLRLKIQ
jgi:hypothetical protein